MAISVISKCYVTKNEVVNIHTWLSVFVEYMARKTSTKRSSVVPGSRVSSLQKLRNLSLRKGYRYSLEGVFAVNQI